MSKDFFDDAYQMESRKFPAIFRLTKLNKFILLALVVIYIALSIILGFLLGNGEEVDTFFILIMIGINIAFLIFAYNCLLGNAPYFLQGLMLVAIPLWSVALIVFPKLSYVSNYFYVLPLLWLEIMLIVERIVHKRAQRTAMQFADMERDHFRRMRNDL